MIHRSRVDHGCGLRTLSQIKRPTAKSASASGMSARTRVAKRALSKLKPKAANAISAGRFPYPRNALLNSSHAINAAETSEGKRHAMSHDRVTRKIAADIQPVSGGLVASP